MIYIRTKITPTGKNIVATLYTGPKPVNPRDYSQRVVRKYDLSFDWYDNHRHAAFEVLSRYNKSKKREDLKLVGEYRKGFWFEVKK